MPNAPQTEKPSELNRALTGFPSWIRQGVAAGG